MLSNPTLAPADFYEILADKLGLADASGSKGRFLLAFKRDLLERHKAGGLTALVIDEAQSLSHELFEEIRLLANLETSTAKLVNVVLVGQPELAARLNDPTLRQLKQRVVLRCSLTPLDLPSTASYVAGRLRVAGASPLDVFSKEAIVAIFEASRGIPRTIGVICENALIAGYTAQKKPVDVAIVADVCRASTSPPTAGSFTRECWTRTPRNRTWPPRSRTRPLRSRAGPRAAGPGPRAAGPGRCRACTPGPGRHRPQRNAFRFRSPSRTTESRPEPAEKDPDTPAVDDRTRIFRFS